MKQQKKNTPRSSWMIKASLTSRVLFKEIQFLFLSLLEGKCIQKEPPDNPESTETRTNVVTSRSYYEYIKQIFNKLQFCLPKY